MAPLTRRQLLACAPPASLGAAVFFCLLVTFKRVLLETCGASEWTHHNIPTLEQVMRAGFCLQKTVFGALFSGSVGLLVFGDHLCLLGVYFLSFLKDTTCTEATSQIVVLCLTPFLGASGSFSLFWLPAHLRNSARGRPNAAARAPARLTRDGAATVTAVLSALVALLGPWLVAEDTLWALLLPATIFPFMIPVLAQALCFSRNSEAAPKHGQRNEVRRLDFVVLLGFVVAAALGLSWRIFSCLVLVSNSSARGQFLAVLTSESASDAVVRYVLVDTVGLSLCFAYLALLENGPLAAFCALAGAAALGPAATMALYLAYRERQIDERREKGQGNGGGDIDLLRND